MLRSPLFVLLLLCTRLVWAQEGALPIAASHRTPALEQNVTLAEPPKPLKEVLRDLTEQTKVPLHAYGALQEQRVSVYAKREPLAAVMEKIARLLSHSEDGPLGYRWEEASDEAPSLIGYILSPTPQAKKMYQEERNRPRTEVMQELVEIGKRIKNYPLSPRAQAVNRLTPQELEQLFNGRRFVLPVDANLAAALEADYNDTVQQNKQRGDTREFPAYQRQHDVVTLGITTLAESFQSASAPEVYLFCLTEGDYKGVMSGFYLNQSAALIPEEHLLPISKGIAREEPVYDLAPILEAKDVTDEQCQDLGFVVNALAKLTGKPFYVEFFYTASRFGGTPSALTTRKGTLPELVNALCRNWNYRVEEKEGTYFLWSRTWAADKEADISEAKVVRWRERVANLRKKSKSLGSEDFLRMARELTLPQMITLLRVVEPNRAGVRTAKDYQDLRFINRMTAAERKAAQRPEGVPVTALSPATQKALAGNLVHSTPYTGLSPSAQDARLAQLKIVSQRAGPFGLSVRLERSGKQIW